MKIIVSDLQKIACILLDYFEMTTGEVLHFQADWYWVVLEPFQESSPNLGIGSIADSLEHLPQTITGEYCTSTNTLMWMAEIFMYMQSKPNTSIAAQPLKNDLHITIQDLKKLCDILLKSAYSAWGNELVFEKDTYQMIVPQEKYTITGENPMVATGSLFQDIVELQRLLRPARANVQPVDFNRFGMILLALAYKVEKEHKIFL